MGSPPLVALLRMATTLRVPPSSTASASTLGSFAEGRLRRIADLIAARGRLRASRGACSRGGVCACLR
eukprot:4315997-Alexandrium_andersonii.AAC.1